MWPSIDLADLLMKTHFRFLERLPLANVYVSLVATGEGTSLSKITNHLVKLVFCPPAVWCTMNWNMSKHRCQIAGMIKGIDCK